MGDVVIDMTDNQMISKDIPEFKSPNRQYSKSQDVNNGWNKKVRGLVKLWTVQTSLNRRYHQLEAVKMDNQSKTIKILAAVFGSLAAFASFLNSALSVDSSIHIIINVVAGLCASIGTLLGVVLAVLNLDIDAEKNRQTSVQYGHISNEGQSLLVEHNAESLPRASDFLKRMADLTYLIQLFAPPLAEREDSDLPNMILMKGLNDKKSTSTGNKFNIDDVFDQISEEDSNNARRNRFKQILTDAEVIKRKKQELQIEEDELNSLKNIILSNKTINNEIKHNQTASSTEDMSHIDENIVQATTLQDSLLQPLSNNKLSNDKLSNNKLSNLSISTDNLRSQLQSIPNLNTSNLLSKSEANIMSVEAAIPQSMPLTPLQTPPLTPQSTSSQLTPIQTPPQVTSTKYRYNTPSPVDAITPDSSPDRVSLSNSTRSDDLKRTMTGFKPEDFLTELEAREDALERKKVRIYDMERELSQKKKIIKTSLESNTPRSNSGNLNTSRSNTPRNDISPKKLVERIKQSFGDSDNKPPKINMQIPKDHAKSSIKDHAKSTINVLSAQKNKLQALKKASDYSFEEELESDE